MFDVTWVVLLYKSVVLWHHTPSQYCTSSSPIAPYAISYCTLNSPSLALRCIWSLGLGVDFGWPSGWYLDDPTAMQIDYGVPSVWYIALYSVWYLLIYIAYQFPVVWSGMTRSLYTLPMHCLVAGTTRIVAGTWMTRSLYTVPMVNLVSGTSALHCIWSLVIYIAYDSYSGWYLDDPIAMQITAAIRKHDLLPHANLLAGDHLERGAREDEEERGAREREIG
eukprot:3220467-Rhodomonas_salina.1